MAGQLEERRLEQNERVERVGGEGRKRGRRLLGCGGGRGAFSRREPRRRAGDTEPDLTPELTGALWWLQREQLVRDRSIVL